MYRVDGQGTEPRAAETVTWTCGANETLEKSLRISSENMLRSKAIHSALITIPLLSGQTFRSARDMYQIQKKNLRYKVEGNSSFFKFPSEIVLKSPVESRYDSQGLSSSATDLAGTFTPQTAGKYLCKVILTCLDASDVRVFQIQGIARSQGLVAELEFLTTARQAIIQELPIINKSDEDWLIKSHLSGAAGFTCPLTFVAKAKSKSAFPVKLDSAVSCKLRAVLILNNTRTNQRFTYQIVGHVQDPLPEGTLSIETSVKSHYKQKLLVHNHHVKDALFHVVTDIACAHGDSEILIPANETVTYELDLCPKQSGNISNTIRFVNQLDNSFCWYQFDVPLPNARLRLLKHLRNTR